MPSGALRSGGGYSQIPISNFSGGLNLAAGADDPDIIDSGQAIDLLNVVFTTLGAVKQRLGYQKLASSPYTNQPDSIQGVYTSTGTKRLLLGNGNRIDALNTSGTSVANVAPTAHPQYFQRIGTPAAEAVYISNGTDTVRKYVPSTDTFSTPAYTGTTPTGKFVAATYDFRLANACTTANPSRVLFSDPGTPETFGANNFVDLDPGDGEAIQGMAAWGSMLFVFKDTKFYVFTNTSTDSSGNPVFNYYPVRGGVGCVGGNAIAVAPDGLYFLDKKGVYKTTGKEPVQISQLIDPFFLGNAAIYFQSNTANQGQIGSASLCWYNHRLYVSVCTGTSTTQDRVLVFDTRYGWWSLFDFPASCMTVWRPSNIDELLFGYSSGTKDVGRYSDFSTLSADNMSNTATGGTATVARWRSGWFSYYFRYRGRWFPDLTVHTVRQGKIFGEGQLSVQLAADYNLNPNAGNTITLTGVGSTWSGTWVGTTIWGPAATTRPKLVRHIGIRGSVISVLLSNSTLNQTFTVHQFETHLRGPSRRPSVVETDD